MDNSLGLSEDQESHIENIFEKFEKPSGFNQILECFGLDEEKLKEIKNPDDMNMIKTRHLIFINDIRLTLIEAINQNDIQDDDPIKIEWDERLNRISNQFFYNWEVIINLWRSVHNPNHFSDNGQIEELALTEMMDVKMKDLDLVYQWFFRQVHMFGYKRYNDKLARPLYTVLNGKKIRNGAWDISMTIEEFLVHITSLEYNPKMFCFLGSKKLSNIKSCAEHISMMPSAVFPELVKDRSVFVFSNGVFFGRCVICVKCNSVEAVPPFNIDCKMKLMSCSNCCHTFTLSSSITTQYTHKFHDFEKNGELKWSGVAAHQFEVPFTDYSNLPIEDIPTPNYDKILSAQKYSFDQIDKNDWKTSEAKQMNAMLGRMLFDVKELDGWEVMFYLLGSPGTGKSTIINTVIEGMYDREDVGILEPNVETTFGMSQMASKYVILASEMGGSQNLNQNQFQKIISGEKVSLAVKHKDAKVVSVRAHLLAAGNELPNYKDQGGALARRFFVAPFMERLDPIKRDSELSSRLEEERGAILQALIRSYHELRNKWGNKSINSWQLDKFKTASELVQMESNSLFAFLKSDSVKISQLEKNTTKESLQISSRILSARYKEYCVTNDIGKESRYRMNSESARSTLAQFGIQKHEQEKGVYIGICDISRIQTNTEYQGEED